MLGGGVALGDGGGDGGDEARACGGVFEVEEGFDGLEEIDEWERVVGEGGEELPGEVLIEGERGAGGGGGFGEELPCAGVEGLGGGGGGGEVEGVRAGEWDGPCGLFAAEEGGWVLVGGFGEEDVGGALAPWDVDAAVFGGTGPALDVVAGAPRGGSIFPEEGAVAGLADGHGGDAEGLSGRGAEFGDGTADPADLVHEFEGDGLVFVVFGAVLDGDPFTVFEAIGDHAAGVADACLGFVFGVHGIEDPCEFLVAGP